MLVEVWVRADLIRQPEPSPPSYRRIAQWEDPDSPTPMMAAQRVWRVCSSGARDLTADEKQWQAQWRANRHGYGFAVGDIAVVDGTAFRCDQKGFEPTDHPGRRD